MDIKVPLSNETFTTDVAPLPSAPPPSYDDACATASNIYQFNQSSASSVQAGNLPYPVQPVQVTPAVMAATINHLPVGRQPLRTTCPSCNQNITTRIRVRNRFSPTFLCILLCITCVCMPCSCCPYFCCGDPLKVQHFCPRCNAFLGMYVDHS